MQTKNTRRPSRSRSRRKALCMDPGVTLDDLREAVTTLEDVEQIARRVLGGAHPMTNAIEECLRLTQAALGSTLASYEL